jgi:hypothetical protein
MQSRESILVPGINVDAGSKNCIHGRCVARESRIREPLAILQ